MMSSFIITRHVYTYGRVFIITRNVYTYGRVFIITRNVYTYGRVFIITRFSEKRPNSKTKNINSAAIACKI